MIQPGLERIGLLLKDIQFPWKTIHVAGTNGKGSICNVASHLLSRRLIRNGCFSSPHLIHRSDCITINNKPVDPVRFHKVENHFKQMNENHQIGASEFELLTATAFQLFNDHKVDVGVVEVGMGGRLDATNILQNQIISVISKIAGDHQKFLGDTLEEIALHKAGILRRGVPYIVNPVNEFHVLHTIRDYANEIGAGPEIIPDTPERREELFRTKDWLKLADRLLPFQRDNAVLGYLAFTQALESLGESSLKASRFLPSLRNKTLPGRMQSVRCPAVLGGHTTVLVDGAHNPDAARELRTYVNRYLRHGKQKRGSNSNPDVKRMTWVIAMTEGKDAREFLKWILKPGDVVLTTSFGPVDGMPWVEPMDPVELKKIALEVEPEVTVAHVSEPEPLRALCAAKYLADGSERIVVTGSLYLAGQFLRDKEKLAANPDSIDVKTFDKEERRRMNATWAYNSEDIPIRYSSIPLDAESQKLREEINKLNREMEDLEVEEARLKRSQSLNLDSSSSSDLSSSSSNGAPAPTGVNDLDTKLQLEGPTIKKVSGFKTFRFTDSRTWVYDGPSEPNGTQLPKFRVIKHPVTS
ncbi:FolC bifunctional protein [Periconia macrospinosa]|uniref:FolC bifunctional protein n=1 Tax=Periconia macrospinosa TaxID=97972 RepID=A0A2V1EBR1_9PLEO|nr:FolC bifunctional protein [Periconia macrospinosa]